MEIQPRGMQHPVYLELEHLLPIIHFMNESHCIIRAMPKFSVAINVFCRLRHIEIFVSLAGYGMDGEPAAVHQVVIFSTEPKLNPGEPGDTLACYKQVT